MYPAHAVGVSSRMIELSTGVRVRVAEAGPVSGPPVVMLHGWAACLYTFRHALDLLPVLGFRVIAADMRGFGLADRPDRVGAYRIDAYLADLDALFQALTIGRAPLVGHSMGGGVALRYALERPERVDALALINPTELVPIPALQLVRVLPRPVLEALGERVVSRRLSKLVLEHIAYGDASRVTPRDVDEYWAPTQIPGFVRALRRTATEFDWRPISDEQARSLKVPATVVLGTWDRLVRNARPAALRLAGAHVHEVEGGHCVHEERPREVYNIISGLLSSVTR
jgi:pimeloyl-ACP methyl ester carboxylesterase